MSFRICKPKYLGYMYVGKDCYQETIPTWSFFLWVNLYLNFSEPRGIQLKVQCRDPTYVPISKTTRVNNNLGQSHQTPTLTRHFCNLFGLLRNEICRKKKRSPPPRRAREQSLQKISWNGGGDHLALQCHIKSNQLKHNGAFLPPCTVFYALWSWPLFGIAIALLEMLDTSTLTSSTLKITKCSNLCNFLLICLCAIILLKKTYKLSRFIFYVEQMT